VARAERREARTFYARESLRSAENFDRAVDAALDMLEQYPHAAAADESNVRAKVVMGFPYSIFYLAKSDLYVVAVAHHSRRPGYWRDRL
jgi:plasmid stabilization system protein ParE